MRGKDIVMEQRTAKVESRNLFEVEEILFVKRSIQAELMA